MENILESIKILEKVSSASAYSALWDLGYKNTWMRGIYPLTVSGTHIVGPAVTVKYLPYKKRLEEDTYRKSAIFQAALTAREGDIVVMDAMGMDCGVIGDCIAMGFKVKGVAGVVIDGGVRDTPLIRRIGLPVYARCATPAHIGEKIVPVSLNTPIECAGVQVNPGDIIVADDDGVVVIPKEIVSEAAKLGLKHERLDEESRRRISEGMPLGEAYPPKEEWLRSAEE
ncbi:MAG: ribonuclease activity regulator RraA [Candidatus Bathyarchaeia archaeon]